MTSGTFGYTAFVVDAYAGTITGWECALSKHTASVESAVRQAAEYRARAGHPLQDSVHHSDAGSQYTSVHFGQQLLLAGMVPSIGTVGDCLLTGQYWRGGPVLWSAPTGGVLAFAV